MGIAIDLKEAIALFVEELLPRDSGDKKILRMAVLVTATPKGKPNRQAFRTVGFVFHRPRNYTKVLAAVNNNHCRPEDFTQWKVWSDHDSCWRDDGIGSVLAGVEWEMSKKFGLSPSECEFAANFPTLGEPKVRNIQELIWNGDMHSPAAITW